MESYTITVADKELLVKPHDDKDQIIFEIYDGNKLLTVIGLNEHAQWEANNDYPEARVREIGDAIESHTS